MKRHLVSLVLAALAAAACDDGAGDGSDGDGSDGDGAGPDAASGGPDASDQPGTPDAGDLPGGPDAGPGPGGDVGQAGPHAVYENDRTAGTVAVTVWAPSGDGGATILPGSHALVVVSPGFQLTRGQYEATARHLASWGFVVVGQDFGGGFTADHMAFANQTIDVIDWALGTSGNGLGASVDPQRIGLAGHSMGGKVSFLAASMDARVGAVVGWDPVDANPPIGAGVSVTPEKMASIGAAVAVLGETLDGGGGGMPCAPSAENYHQYYQHASPPALEVTVTGADHMDWIDSTDGCLACGFCKMGTADGAVVRALTARTSTAWFRRHLDGDTSMDTYLTGAVMQADVTAGKATIMAK